MTYKVLAVRDERTESFGIPIFVRHVGEGTRSFIDEVNREDSQFAKHPEDFALYLVGTYGEETGLLVPCSVPERLVMARDIDREIGRAHV